MTNLYNSLVAAAALIGAIASPAALAGIHIEGSLYQEKNTAPGAVYRGTIAIRNSGATPAQAKLYGTDYTFAADGSNQYGAPGKLARSNGGWLRLSQEQLTIPAHGVASVQYEVSVPADDTLKGSYWSMIMIESLSAAESADGEALKKGQARAALTAVTRYGVQVASDIGDTGRRELQFSNPRLVEGKDAKRFLAVDVGNTGERSLNPQISLDLNGAQDGAAKKVTGSRQRLYPGSSARFQLDVSAMPAGTYRALVTADAGGDDVFGSQFELTIH
jgi:hypothetical protein